MAGFALSHACKGRWLAAGELNVRLMTIKGSFAYVVEARKKRAVAQIKRGKIFNFRK